MIFFLFQLRALQGRQEALLAIQRDAEIRLRQERTNNEGITHAFDPFDNLVK